MAQQSVNYTHVDVQKTSWTCFETFYSRFIYVLCLWAIVSVVIKFECNEFAQSQQ